MTWLKWCRPESHIVEGEEKKSTWYYWNWDPVLWTKLDPVLRTKLQGMSWEGLLLQVWGARWLSGRVSDSGARGPGSRPTAAVLCPWARHFTPRKYWLITQEAMAPSRHDWKIVDWDVKPQHNQPTNCYKFIIAPLWKRGAILDLPCPSGIPWFCHNSDETWISLRPVGQCWSNFIWSIMRVGKRVHKVLRQIGSKLWFPWQQKAPIDL